MKTKNVLVVKDALSPLQKGWAAGSPSPAATSALGSRKPILVPEGQVVPPAPPAAEHAARACDDHPPPRRMVVIMFFGQCGQSRPPFLDETVA